MYTNIYIKNVFKGKAKNNHFVTGVTRFIVVVVLLLCNC